MCKSMFGPEVIRRVELTSLQDRKHSKISSDVVLPAEKLFLCQRTLTSIYRNLSMYAILLLSHLLQSGSKPGLPLSLSLSEREPVHLFDLPGRG